MRGRPAGRQSPSTVTQSSLSEGPGGPTATPVDGLARHHRRRPRAPADLRDLRWLGCRWPGRCGHPARRAGARRGLAGDAAALDIATWLAQGTRWVRQRSTGTVLANTPTRLRQAEAVSATSNLVVAVGSVTALDGEVSRDRGGMDRRLGSGSVDRGWAPQAWGARAERVGCDAAACLVLGRSGTTVRAWWLDASGSRTVDLAGRTVGDGDHLLAPVVCGPRAWLVLPGAGGPMSSSWTMTRPRSAPDRGRRTDGAGRHTGPDVCRHRQWWAVAHDPRPRLRDRPPPTDRRVRSLPARSVGQASTTLTSRGRARSGPRRATRRRRRRPRSMTRRRPRGTPGSARPVSAPEPSQQLGGEVGGQPVHGHRRGLVGDCVRRRVAAGAVLATKSTRAGSPPR